jgi:hypothetical protein
MSDAFISQALSSAALISAAKSEVDAIADTFGAEPSKRHTYISIACDRQCEVVATIYPNGICREPTITGRGATFREAIDNLEKRAMEMHADVERMTIRDMAILIMRSHADHGECRPEHLRVSFDQSVIDRLGKEACAEAERIAGSGPFTISMGAARANAPAEE